MKRLLFSLSMIGFGFSAVAQSIVTTTPQYQTAVLEEYTGIHCQYCPDGHKLAKELKADYPGRVILVNIHEGGYAVPGASEPDFRTQYGTALSQQTGLTGYPSGTVNRRVFPYIGSAMAMGRGAWRFAAEDVIDDVSALNLGASTSYNSSTREITINVEALFTEAGVGSYNLLNIALLQDSIEGPQTGAAAYNPGDLLPNGKYVHGHMLRDLITGQWGDTIPSTAKGALFTKTYTYTIPADVNGVAINPDHCHLAIYATDTRANITQGISLGIDGDVNDGNNAPYYGSFSRPTAVTQAGSAGNTSTFSLNFNGTLNTDQDYVIEFDTDAPSGWSATYTAGGTTHSGNAVVNISASNTNNFNIAITPDATPAVAQYTLTAYPVFDSSSVTKMSVHLISNVTDLVVTGSGSPGSAGMNNTYSTIYENGLSTAGCSTVASTTAGVMWEASVDNALTGVQNIYMNIGWTFPSFSDDEVLALMDFMDNGGNILVAGQDIGWDINDPNGYGTANTKSFYTNYLHANYIDDGSGARNQFVAETSDAIYGNVSTSTIVDKYSGNIFPDNIAPNNGAQAIFHYNDSTEIGGIRFENSNYKVIYLGIGLEMLQDASVKDEIMDLSYQWFNGTISTEEFDFAMKGVRLYPNPSQGNFQLEVPQAGKYDVSITDALGRVIYNKTETTHTNLIGFSGLDLSSGIYMVSVRSGSKKVTAKLIVE